MIQIFGRDAAIEKLMIDMIKPKWSEGDGTIFPFL